MTATTPDRPLRLEPIGVVRSPRRDIQDTTGWGEVTADIQLVPELGAHSLDGLADFSHVEIVFWFHRTAARPSYAELTRARGRADMPEIGVFAARGPNRPNPIGVSACRLLEVRPDGLTVAGLDAVDGTPVLDVKPVQPRLLPTDVSEPDWSARLMADYYQR